MTSDPTASAGLKALRALWQQRSARERMLVLSGATLLGLLMVWRVALAPAWSVWREAPVREAQLQAHTQQMLQLQAQARQLQALPRLGRAQAVEQLKAGADSLLGSGAQLQVQGELLHVKLQASAVSGLAQWLVLAREQAQARPVQVQLQRQDAPAAAPSSEPTWQGTVVLRLP